MDKIAFPNHKHGAHDFYHGQLFEQEYYKEDIKPENKDRFLQRSPTAYPYRDRMKKLEQSSVIADEGSIVTVDTYYFSR